MLKNSLCLLDKAKAKKFSLPKYLIDSKRCFVNNPINGAFKTGKSFQSDQISALCVQRGIEFHAV